MFFAGFALFLNGVSYFVPFNRKMLGYVNLFAAAFMSVNTLAGLYFAPEEMSGNYANAAAGCAFALNFLILGVHHIKEMTDFSLFGWFALLMSIVSATFLVQACIAVPSDWDWLFIYLWSMWAVLWGQAFIASGLKIKAVDKLSPYIILANAVFSLIVPALLILFGVLL